VPDLNIYQMRRKLVYTVLLIIVAVAAKAQQKYELIYQGFPYAKTTCANPSYVAGQEIQLSLGKPTNAEKTFLYWQYNGANYMPGATFSMPAQNVELVPVYEGDATATENIEIHTSANKMIRNGQLLIIHNGKIYNTTGQQIQ
jgi:hypothetical protein